MQGHVKLYIQVGIADPKALLSPKGVISKKLIREAQGALLVERVWLLVTTPIFSSMQL